MEDHRIKMEHFIDNSYWDIFIFSARKEDFKSLLDFGYASAYQEYQWEIDFQRRQSEEYNRPIPEPYPWEKYWAKFHSTSIPVSVFFEKRAFYMPRVKDSQPMLLTEESVTAAMILDEEWNSVFIIAETESIYVGYMGFTGD